MPCYPSSVVIRASSSCIVLTSNGTSFALSIICGFILSSSFTASFAPITASGIIPETSCAKNPSCIVLAVSAIQLNLSGLSYWSLLCHQLFYLLQLHRLLVVLL